MPNIAYQRLTRARSRGWIALAVMSRTSLWLGPDHLLLVDFNGYTETYKRFYFRDIQAFLMQRSEAFTVIYVLLGIPFVLFMVLGLVNPLVGWKIFLFSVAGLLAILGLIHILRGPTCRCFLRTAVQVEQLPPLSRVRRAQKVFDRLRPLIVAAQGGDLSSQAIADHLRENARSGAAATAPTAEPADRPAGAAPLAPGSAP
jgi:hypothetical protein